MKKAFVFLFIVSFSLSLTSCKIGDQLMGKFYETDDQIAEKRIEQVIEAIQKKNEELLKSMFSEKAISEAENFDESVTELMEFFQGNFESRNEGTYGTNEEFDEPSSRIKELQSTYDIKTSEQKYRIAILEIIVDTKHPDNVGIKSLYIINAKDSDMQYAYWGHGKWNPGIVIE